MKWNWQLPDWPNFTWDKARLAVAEEQFLIGGGVLMGTVKHLGEEERNQLTVEAMSTEAVTTSEIEGEILDRARSPSADRSGAPDGGLISALTAVSSMPLTIGAMVMVPPESQLVRLLVAYRVAPVPYSIRLELNGSIARSSVIQPSR